MKRKMKGVLGVGLAFVLVASLMVFAIPVAADPGEVIEPEANEWTAYEPTPGAAGDWFYSPTIGSVGPIAEAIDGDLYAGSLSAVAGAVAEVSTVTLSGSPRAGDVVTVTVDGNAVAYTVLTGDIGVDDAASLANIAVKVAAAINADATVGAIVNATSAAAVVTLTADVAGTAGAFTLACAVTLVTAGDLDATAAETTAAVAAVAQVDTITPVVASSETYVLSITPTATGVTTDFVYTSDSSATATEIVDAFVLLITSNPLMTTVLTAANVSDTLVLTAVTAGVPDGFTTADNSFGPTGSLGIALTIPAANAIAEISTVTLSGSPRAGDVVTVTVDGNAVAYTVLTGDIGATDALSLAAIAAKVAAAINADATVGAIVNATSAAAVVTLTADVAGTAGAFTLASSVTNITDSTIAIACAETTAAVNAATGAVSLFKSEDGGRTWATSTSTTKSYNLVSGLPIVDMVCSSMDEDILYVTDGNYVYKSVDGFDTFVLLAAESLEAVLEGECGQALTDLLITCIDVGYDANDNPLVFIGTKATWFLGDAFGTHDGPPSVLYIAEAVYPVEWNDLQLQCYGCCSEGSSPAFTGCYTPYSVGVSPEFADTGEVFAVVTTSDADCDGTANDPETHVISTKGTICNWTEQAELLWNCVLPNHFDISAASRIGFPEDWADSETLYVGVVGLGGVNNHGGDVYSVTSPSAIDLNVAGSATGCIGLYHADIISLDVVGEADDASLIAGAFDASASANIYMLYYSYDGGWEWDHCDKCPSGDELTYVLWVGDSAIAATSGCECAVSLSCGEEVGEYWNQISLIATDITWVGDIDHSPAYYSGASETFFMVTECVGCCGGSTHSVFRYDGTYWERVYVSTIFSDTLIDWVQVSPDADTTEAVFLANQEFDVFRSLDYGCSWTLMRYPCAPKPSITAWVVIDEETVVCGGGGVDAGTIFKTTNHGARPWKEYIWDKVAPGNAICFALEPGYEDPGSILLGDNKGQVFISEDGAEEWDEIVDSLFAFSSVETYVIFDPGYGTSGDEGENMVYAAAGDTIGRCDIDPDAKWSKQDWKAIYDDLAAASGIDAAGDTALYVADRGSAAGTAGVFKASGTIAVRYTCASTTLCTCDLTIDNSDDNVLHVISGTFEVGEPVSIIEYNLYCVAAKSIHGEILVEGLLNGGIGRIDIIEGEDPCDVCTVPSGAVEVISSYLTVTTAAAPAALGIPSGVVRSLNPMADVTPTMKVVFEDLLLGLSAPPATYSPELWHHADSDDLWLTTRSNVLWTLDWNNRTYIWVWDDPLATPVIQETPSNGAQLTSTSKVTLEWAELDDADEYEINLYRYCAECPDEKLAIDVDNSTDTCAIVSGLDAGTLYYWEVRVALGEPFLSKWSGLWEFTTALGEVPYLCSPVCGASDVILTTNFSWDAVSGAGSYEIELATNEDFDPVIASGTATVNAWVASPELDYSTTYYWRVRAVKDGIPGAWSVCIFTTEAAPAVPPEPVPPVVIPPAPAPITPMWIWVIIGIGAALTIAVIVLIVTTRRVP